MEKLVPPVTVKHISGIARAVCIVTLCAASAGATATVDAGKDAGEVSTGGSRAQAPAEGRSNDASRHSSRSPFDDDGLVLGVMAGYGTIAGWVGAFAGHELGFGPLRALNPFAALAIGVTPYTGTQVGGLLRVRPLRLGHPDVWLLAEIGYSQGNHDTAWIRSPLSGLATGPDSCYGVVGWLQPAFGFESRYASGFGWTALLGAAVPLFSRGVTEEIRGEAVHLTSRPFVLPVIALQLSYAFGRL
jgi:hypothetical protein